MRKRVFIELFGMKESNDWDEFVALLNKLKISVDPLDEKYTSGRDGFILSWDSTEVFNSRKAGRKQKFLNWANTGKLAWVSEVKDRIVEVGVLQTSQELGVSRATLYNRLKSAEGFGDDSVL